MVSSGRVPHFLDLRDRGPFAVIQPSWTMSESGHEIPQRGESVGESPVRLWPIVRSRRLRDHLGAEAEELLKHPFGIVNVWRPIRSGIWRSHRDVAFGLEVMSRERRP